MCSEQAQRKVEGDDAMIDSRCYCMTPEDYLLCGPIVALNNRR